MKRGRTLTRAGELRLMHRGRDQAWDIQKKIEQIDQKRRRTMMHPDKATAIK